MFVPRIKIPANIWYLSAPVFLFCLYERGTIKAEQKLHLYTEGRRFISAKKQKFVCPVSALSPDTRSGRLLEELLRENVRETVIDPLSNESTPFQLNTRDRAGGRSPSSGSRDRRCFSPLRLGFLFLSAPSSFFLSLSLNTPAIPLPETEHFYQGSGLTAGYVNCIRNGRVLELYLFSHTTGEHESVSLL